MNGEGKNERKESWIWRKIKEEREAIYLKKPCIIAKNKPEIPAPIIAIFFIDCV